MVYEFHHNHSFIDHQEVVSATVRDPVRNWFIQQALEGRIGHGLILKDRKLTLVQTLRV